MKSGTAGEKSQASDRQSQITGKSGRTNEEIDGEASSSSQGMNYVENWRVMSERLPGEWHKLLQKSS